MDKKGLAIVTGAGSGIGKALAEGLAEDGYRVVLIGRSREKLQVVYDRIVNRSGNAREPVLLAMDINDSELLDREIRKLNGRFGAVDILANAAAMHIRGSLSASVEKYREIVNLNLIAQYALFKTVAEIMKKQKSGYIFNIASRSGRHGFPEGGVYGSTKFALVGLAESLCRDLSPLGIRVTSLCPGYVNTPMAQQAGTPFAVEEMIQPGDLLATVRYLLSLSPNARIKEILIEMKDSMV